MGKERAKRIAIITAVGLLTAWGVTAFAKWYQEKKVAGVAIEIPTETLSKEVEELGEKVLGKAVDVLPGGEKIKEKEKIVEREVTKTEMQSTETTKILETQTKEIIEILKQLPEEQLKQIKKQIFKDFCQEVMGE